MPYRRNWSSCIIIAKRLCNNNSPFVSYTVHFDDIILSSAYYNITPIYRIWAYRTKQTPMPYSCRLDSKIINNSITHEIKLYGVHDISTSRLLLVYLLVLIPKGSLYTAIFGKFLTTRIDMSHEFHPVSNNNYYHNRV